MAGEFVDQVLLSQSTGCRRCCRTRLNWVIQIASSLLNIAAVLGAFLTLFALISVMERKILATHLLAFFSRWPTGSSR